ncbi:MAG: RsmD family RNA methyltransferase [Planctomycetota bacterium]|jgi:16S rRNA (guanine966-N2)-methyltransferase
MRIIAGAKRGMKLLSPKTSVSRPITDRVKESLFSVLYKYGLPAGKIVADLFCGVGSLGLEALSRDAAFVTLNIEKAGFIKNSKVITADAFKIGAPVDKQKYNLVFVDPPYAFTSHPKEDLLLSGLLDMLSEQLAKNGIVVVRTHRRTKLLDEFSHFRIMERRQWGTMAVTILQYQSNDK